MAIDLTKMPKLGFGMMRLPCENDVIQIDRVCEMVDAYLVAGLNYFDTAYVYHGGKSETAIREALVKRHNRSDYMIADKLPAWSMKVEADRDKIFNEQLDRLGTDYIDFYLLHSLEDGNNYDTYERLDCFNWGIEKKKEGKIKYFGFSYHGTPELLNEVLDKHPEIEFVQIQLNYADWNNPVVQSGKLYEILHERNIPMIIMEPVKGGRLASLEPEFAAILKAANPDKSQASFALRFVASLPGVMTILSGMSSEDQMKDNLNTFTNFEPLNQTEKEAVDKVVQKMTDLDLVECTSCRYCCDGCPSNINIPEIFKALNTIRLYPGDDFRPKNFYQKVTEGAGKASECINCGQCESVCPQHLAIPSLMDEVVQKLES